MAQMPALSLLTLVLALCIPRTQGSDVGAQDCCLRYSQKKIPYYVVGSYRMQDLSLGCPIPAILFSPKKRSYPELCADPRKLWVRQLMKYLDTPPASRGCRKDRGAHKSGKKRKGSKGCQRNKQPQTPKVSVTSPDPRPQ